MVQELKNAMRIAGVVEIHCTTIPTQEPLEIWDEIMNEPVPGGSNSFEVHHQEPASTGPLQIEDQIMPLPSNGNVGLEYAQLELTHRISHAENHLNRIRDLIAEKSFQFSHVIRVAPRKAVNTRSRAEVKKINLQISVHCRLYTQCRARLIKLGASPETLNRYQIITTGDIKASTAIVNPNEPGSTQLKLSWIWQSAGGHRWGLASGIQSAGSSERSAGIEANVFECKYFYLCLSLAHIMCSSSCPLAPRTRAAHEMARRSHSDRL
jgi:hypothetical protein